MERAVVSSVVGRLGDMLIQEAKFLAGVRDQVEQLWLELKRMQSFLEDTDHAIHDDDDADARVMNRAAEIRELAYEAEAILETYVNKVASKGKGGIQKVLNLRSVHKVGNQIQTIKDKITDHTRSLKTYSTGGPDQVTSLARERKLEVRRSYHHVIDEDFVGFEQDLKTVVNHLMEVNSRESHQQACERGGTRIDYFWPTLRRVAVGFHWAIMLFIGAFSMVWRRQVPVSPRLNSNSDDSDSGNSLFDNAVSVNYISDYRIVSICGMGGLGKTTLARRVYHHRDVRTHFHCFAWACISQQYQTRNILQGILCQLVPDKKEEVSKMTNEELYENLYQVQQMKKCLVVLDDIWSMDAWHSLKSAFPIEKNGSKILLTTRNQKLASQIHPCHFLHELRCLNEKESWDLFEKKALLRRDGTGSRIDTNMEALGRQMVKRCGGLPLAIVVLGGLLVTKSTSREWDMVYKKVKSRRWIEDDGVSKVLALSYHDLPYQLKPCFLYLSYFPEDYAIDAENLYYLWMAEGFLSTEDRGEEETMMEVAECYLGELAQRCMVQVLVNVATGRIEFCFVHDILRDVCISKAKIHNFLRTIYLQRETDQVDLFSTSTTKIRRLGIHLNRDVENVVLPVLESTQQLRSILFFKPYSTCSSASIGWPSLQLNSHFKNLKLLRTLDLQGLDLRNMPLPLEAIGELHSLRYLSFRNCTIRNLPQSMSKLRYLETLDLRTYFLSDEVIVLKKMERLRHLYLAYNAGFRYQFKLDGLGNLETLDGFHTGNCDVNDLCKLTNLRHLKAEFHGSEGNNQDLAAFINYLSISASQLRQTSLTIFDCNFSSEEGLILLRQLLGCHHLYSLHISGRIPKLPEHQCFSPVRILVLNNCELKEDPMPTLESLPNLKSLKVADCSIDKMVVSAKGFPQLESLEIGRMSKLKEFTVEKGAMPNLSSLHLASCRELEMVPEGVRFITSLQHFSAIAMGTIFYHRLPKGNGRGGADFGKLRHVPHVHIL